MHTFVMPSPLAGHTWGPVLACLCLLAGPAAAGPVTQVSALQHLSFGTFLAGSLPSHIQVSPAGLRSVTAGDATLLRQAGGHAARFRLQVEGGPPHGSCAVQLPQDEEGTTLGSAGRSMRLAGFQHSLANGSFPLNGAGQADIHVLVGARLELAASQAAGTYDTRFTIGVACP